MLQVFAVRGIVRPHGEFCSDERVESYDRDLHSVQFENLRVARGLFPCDPARPGHEIDRDFVSNPNDFITAHFVGRYIPNGIVGKHCQGSLDPLYVLGRGVNEEIDVLRRPLQAVGDHGEATDQQVASSLSIQSGADSDEIFRPWLT